MAAVVRWFEDLPPALMRRNGALCVARAFTGLYASDMHLADEWLQAAQRTPATDAQHPDDAAALEAAIGVGRASHRYFIGDMAEALSAAQRAAELLVHDEGNPRLWIATGIVGVVTYWTGDIERAQRMLTRVAPLAEATGHNFVAIWSLSHLAEMDIDDGVTDGAHRSLAHAALVAERNGLLEHYVCGPMQAARARLLWQQGRVDDAAAATDHAVDLVRRSPMRVERVATLIHAARFRAEHGDRARASEFLLEARRLVESFPDPRGIAESLADAERMVTPSGAGYPASLTQREVAVLRLLAQGLTDARIARELFVSLRTVNAHVRSIYRKAGLNNRAVATRFAIDNDLL